MFIVWAFRHGLVPSGGFIIVVIVAFEPRQPHPSAAGVFISEWW
jgi:hypothetical protein